MDKYNIFLQFRYRMTLKSFIIGSSFPAMIPSYYYVKNIPHPQRQFHFHKYAYTAPIYFGILNSVSAIIGSHFGTTLVQRLFITAQVSAIFMIMWITYHKDYKFSSKREWYNHYLQIYMRHAFVFLVVIYLLERFLG